MTELEEIILQLRKELEERPTPVINLDSDEGGDNDPKPEVASKRKRETRSRKQVSAACGGFVSLDELTPFFLVLTDGWKPVRAAAPGERKSLYKM